MLIQSAKESAALAIAQRMSQDGGAGRPASRVRLSWWNRKLERRCGNGLAGARALRHHIAMMNTTRLLLDKLKYYYNMTKDREYEFRMENGRYEGEMDPSIKVRIGKDEKTGRTVGGVGYRVG